MSKEKKISWLEVFELSVKMIDSWLAKLLFPMKSWFRDEYYEPIGVDELNAYLQVWKNNVLPKLAYTPEAFDCDDFGAYFKAWLTKESGKNCVGEAIGELEDKDGNRGGHEWNIVLVKLYDGSVTTLFVEPQIGEAFKKITSDGFVYHLKWVIW